MLVAALAMAWTPLVQADKKTVCTITVNSPDEKDTFRRSLPGDQFQFVELVEHGRPDWLASACRAGVRCDVLLISGHFDDGSEFYSDRLDVRESLPVDEMERVSCSDSCPGLFSQLKEVYLFGCSTLNAGALRSASAEIARSLVRAGHTQADAERLSAILGERHAESSRDRMRRIFKDVPVIYGFSSKAPLGPTAASLLERYFQGGTGEVGTGRTSAKLLGLFAPVSMTSTAGLRDADPQAGYRRDVCHFSDDRLSPAQKTEFVHELLGRDMAEVRMFLDHIEKFSSALDETQRQAPAIAQALETISHDTQARQRYLDFARDADEPAIRARMMQLARSLGWLSPEQQRAELLNILADRVASDAATSRDVDLACSLDLKGELVQQVSLFRLPAAQAARTANAAVLACLGSPEARARVLRALTSANEDDVEIAQVYLHHRPLVDAAELNSVTSGVARMNPSAAQVRALDTLARQSISDPDSVEALARLFPLSRSIAVQRAIAGILVRADLSTLARPELVSALRQNRVKSPDGRDVIDVLLRRMEGR